jgi:AcrR family transcriptional regulator
MSMRRPRRAESTRAAIVTAARERFAAEGYERTTIRSVAAGAGVDPAMVMRYFETKERLFAAATRFEPPVLDLGQVPAERVGELLVRQLLECWERDDALIALLRAGATNDGAAVRLHMIVEAQLRPAVITPGVHPGRAAERAALIASQVLGLALCRHVLRLPVIVDMSIAELSALLAPGARHYLGTASPVE